MQILLLNSGLFDCQWFLTEKLDADFLLVDSCQDLVREFSRRDIALLIVHSEQEGMDDVIQNEIIPPQTPLLILCPGDSLPAWMRARSDSQLVDWLQLPLARQAVFDKIHFLFQVHAQAQTLENYKIEREALNNQLDEYQKSIQHHSEYLNLLSNRDGLTGLFNRRHFAKILHREYQRVMEEDDDLSLLLLNIDYFNEINKSSGLGYGDFVLNELSARLTKNNRATDTCFRYSGENFIVLMPSTDLDTAMETAEKLRSICKDKPFDNGQIKKKLTISIGISSLRVHQPNDHEELITMADQALYIAKAEGRDRVAAYRSAKHSTLSSSEKNFISLKKTISRILDKTRTSAISSLQLLAKDAAIEEHQNHIEQTKKYVQIFCEHLRLPPSIIETFKNAITLHTSIHHLLHTDIICKKNSLSNDDRQTINDFPYKLVEVTQLFDYFSNERTILLYHGERFDGSGYPEGLRGDAIPLGSRIFNLVDALVAMNSDRPYRPKLPPQQILAELVKYAGRQFDPFLVLKLIDVIEKNDLFDLDEQDYAKARKGLLNKKEL